MTKNCLRHLMLWGLGSWGCLGSALGGAADALPVEKIQLKPGFQIEIFAQDLEEASLKRS